jgi:hypothetical protein
MGNTDIRVGERRFVGWYAAYNTPKTLHNDGDLGYDAGLTEETPRCPM